MPIPKLNSTPLQGYEITIQLANAPAFAVVGGRVQFDGANAECKKIQPISGAVINLKHHESIQLTKVSETTYRGIIYTDQMRDANYFGRGICHWKLSYVGVSFRAASDEVSTSYEMVLNENLIKAQNSDTRYFWKGYYPRAKMTQFVDIGDHQLSEDIRRLRGDEFFSITISSKKLVP